MKKVTFAIMGMGNRGYAYGTRILKHPESAEITAMADNRRERLVTANKYANLPEDRLFDSGEALLEADKLADIMIIATQDAQHKNHAIRAMEKGYDLLLEKPVSNDIKDCKEIAEAANRLGRKVLVCHVLRYTVFYRQIKELLKKGIVGDIESIIADEQVGYYHYAHSYVRGNWHNREQSSPMILAKCCHDMDLLVWLTGKKCLKVSSMGSLKHFKAENAPAGATERCTDNCPHAETCPYNALKIYMPRIPHWPTNIINPEPTEENIMEALRTGNYGKCVYHMDNDVVDHQVLNLQFEDEVTATFQMVGPTSDLTRFIRIMGTQGEIWGDFRSKQLYWQKFGQEKHKVDLDALTTDFTGHGGGDDGLIRDAISLISEEENFDTSAITTIDRSVESHYIAFAAEESRLRGGEVITLEDYIKSI